MSFSLPQLLRCRPYLFHLTSRRNLEAITRTRQLRCANALLADAGLANQSSERRVDHLAVSAGGDITLLRDQKPLIHGAIAFEEGWDLARLVQHINQHVFFWPGLASGPIASGINHFERYRAEAPVLLRFLTADLDDAVLRFSAYNSGAPRCSGGRYSPRGSKTCVSAAEFSGSASEVVEVVVAGGCALPEALEASDSPVGPWRSLSGAA
jgi:hypothetical protein